MEPIGEPEKKDEEEAIEAEAYAKDVQASVPDEAKEEIKTPERKIELPRVNLPKIPKIDFGNAGNWMKNKFAEYVMVLKITKKPDKAEFQAIVRASGLGIAVIGTIGFIIHMIVQGIQLVK